MAEDIKEQASDIFKSMVRNGQLKREPSKYLHPTYFIRKKESGKLRFVANMTAINDRVNNQPINLPCIQDVLNSLGRSRYFSVLDIKDAFHQLPVKEGHNKYLGIITPFGHFTYQVAPMGFCNSPTYWQRFIEVVLQGVLGSGVAVYMDDIIIHTRGTLAEHFELVDKILGLLENYNLKCNAKKCRLNAKEFNFLGHKISVLKNGVTRRDHR